MSGSQCDNLWKRVLESRIGSRTGGSAEGEKVVSCKLTADAVKALLHEYADILQKHLKVDVPSGDFSVSDFVNELVEQFDTIEPEDVNLDEASALFERLKLLAEECGAEVESSEPKEVLKAVNNILSSITGGMKDSFMTKLVQLPAIMDKSRVLHKVAKTNIDEIARRVNSLEGNEKHDAEVLLKHTKQAVNDSEALIDMIRGHMSEIKPKTDTLIDLVKDDKDFQRKVSELYNVNLMAKGDDLQKALAIAMKKVGYLPIVADKIHAALKAIDLSINDLANSNSFRSLLDKAGSGVLSGDLVKKIMALDALMKVYKTGNKEDIVKYMQETSNNKNMKGGAKSVPSKYKKSLKVAKAVKKVTFGLFDRTARAINTSIVNNAHAIAEDMQSGKIDVSSKVFDEFISALSMLNDHLSTNANSDSFSASLIDANVSTRSRALKARFVDDLKYLARVASNIKNSNVSAMVANINKLISAIDKYSDAYVRADDYRMKIPATGGAHLDENVGSDIPLKSSNWCNKSAEALPDVDSMGDDGSAIPIKTKEGGAIAIVGDVDLEFADPSVIATAPTEISYTLNAAGVSAGAAWSDQATSINSGSGGPPGTISAGARDDVEIGPISASLYPLSDSITKLKYFHRIIKVKDIMKKSAKLLDGSDGEFRQTLGKSIGMRKSYLNALKTRDMDAIKTAINAAEGNKPEKRRLKGIQMYLGKKYEGLNDFYDSLEALEIYLRNFTDNIINNPTDISDLMSMLNGTTVIVKWFDAKSSQNVAAAVAFANSAIDGDENNRGVHPNNFPQLWNRLLAAFNGLDAFKNITNAFARIGPKTVGSSKSDIMSVNVMYNKLKNFMIMSQIAPVIGEGAPALSDLNLSKDSTSLPSTTNPKDIKKFVLAANKGMRNPCVEERKLLLDMFKAMVAKVFTVTGLFDMFNRPLDKRNHTHYYNSFLRSTVGGGDPTIHPDAVDLYVRLPLLSEWYRKVFHVTTEDDPVISMISEYKNIWAELQEIIHHEGKSIESGLYSDNQYRRIVSAVNRVYEHYKKTHGSRACEAAINAFVEDTNMRFGIVWRKDREAYNKTRRHLLSTVGRTQTSNRDRPDFKTLPGEEDEGFNRPGPSSDYTKMSFSKVFSEYTDDTLLNIDNGRKLIMDFRDRLHNELNINPNSLIKFNELIKKVKSSMSKEQTNAGKFRVLMDMIRSSSHESPGDIAKYAMFIEIINGGMRVLSAYITALIQLHHEILDYVLDGPLPPADNSNYYSDYQVNSKNLTPASLFELLIKCKSLGADVQARRNNLTVDFSNVYDHINVIMEVIRKTLPKFRGIISEEIYQNSFNAFSLFETNSLKYVHQIIQEETGGPAGLSQAIIDNKKYAGIPYALEKLSAVYRSVGGSLAPVTQYFDVTDNFISASDAIETPGTSIYDNLKMLRPLSNEDFPDQALPNATLANENNLTVAASTSGVTNNQASVENADDIKCVNLLYKFNNLLIKYLAVHMDSSTSKIYKPLIAKLEAEFHRNVHQRNAHGAVPSGFYENGPIASLTAYYLQRILTKRIEHRKPESVAFFTDNFSEVSEFMKETMKVSLPFFKTAFQMLKEQVHLAAGINDHPSITNFNNEVANQINRGCEALIKSIESVQADLKDTSIPFETSRGFIRDYTSRNGKWPLGLFSFSLSLAERNSIDLSIQASTDPKFKLMYGSRGFLNSNNVGLRTFAADEVLLKDFNSSVPTPSQISSATLNDFIKNGHNLVKHLAWTLNSFCDFTVEFRPIVDGNRAVEIIEHNDQIAQLKTLITQQGIGVFESDRFVADNNQIRKIARVSNIIELNIMPINIHMLASQVPLTEVFTYSWTFDHLVKNIMDNSLSLVDSAPGARVEAAEEAKEAMINNLVSPSMQSYNTLGIGATNGNTSNLGLAKYAGDLILALRNNTEIAETFLVQDQLFSVQVQRLLRAQMRRDLFSSLDKSVVFGHKAVAREITEEETRYRSSAQNKLKSPTNPYIMGFDQDINTGATVPGRRSDVSFEQTGSL